MAPTHLFEAQTFLLCLPKVVRGPNIPSWLGPHSRWGYPNLHCIHPNLNLNPNLNPILILIRILILTLILIFCEIPIFNVFSPLTHFVRSEPLPHISLIGACGCPPSPFSLLPPAPQRFASETARRERRVAGLEGCGELKPKRPKGVQPLERSESESWPAARRWTGARGGVGGGASCCLFLFLTLLKNPFLAHSSLFEGSLSSFYQFFSVKIYVNFSCTQVICDRKNSEVVLIKEIKPCFVQSIFVRQISYFSRFAAIPFSKNTFFSPGNRNLFTISEFSYRLKIFVCLFEHHIRCIMFHFTCKCIHQTFVLRFSYVFPHLN